MTESVVGILIMIALGLGLVSGWLISRKENEINIMESELEFQKKLEASLKRQVELIKEHNELLETVKHLARNNGSPSDYNKLWEKVRSKLSNH